MRHSLFVRAAAEAGQGLVYEALSLTLIIFAIFGAVSIFHRF